MSDLQTQVDELRRQLDALRGVVQGSGRRKRWPILAMVGAFLLGGLLLGPIWQDRSIHAAQDEKDAKALVCSSLKVVNRDGRMIAALNGDEDGGFLRIYGQDGRERMFVGVNVKAGGGLVMLRDPLGSMRSIWQVTETGLPSITFRNAAGLNDVFLGSSANHWGGLLNLNAPNGRSGAMIDVNDIGEGRISLFDKLDKVIVYAGGNGKGGSLRLSDHDGRDIANLGALDKIGGYLELRDSMLNTTRLNVPMMESLIRRMRELAP